MGRVKKSRGQRNHQPAEVQWTPLRQGCGCVIDWGWAPPGAGPDQFIAWCGHMVIDPCPWHGGETGTLVVDAPRTATLRLRGGGCEFMARMARDADIALGMTLADDLLALQESMKNPAALRKQIPDKYVKWMLADGEDPVQTWTTQRLIDIILNRGRGFITQAFIDSIPE